MQHNRLIMLRLIASRLGATWKVRAIVAHTTSLPQMLNTREALLALADASDVIEVPTALVLRCTSFSSTLAACGFRGAYNEMGAAFLFSIYRSLILNSHQNCPRMKAATAVA